MGTAWDYPNYLIEKNRLSPKPKRPTKAGMEIARSILENYSFPGDEDIPTETNENPKQ